MEVVTYSGGNFLLDRLLPSELESLKPYLEMVQLEAAQLLYAGRAEEPLEYVYFPVDAVTSMLMRMTHESEIEVGLVGREGMIGVQAAFGSTSVLERWTNQMPGVSARMSVGDFRAQLPAQPTLRLVVQLYVQAPMAFLAQSVACSGRHRIVERCARWLLLSHDGAGSNPFSLTHELLALMLNARRAGVSVAAATLQKAGLIRYVRGCVSILDRPGLEAASCECYEIVKAEYDRVFGERF